MSDVRLAVVGAGIMGSSHIRVARTLPNAELVAVVDEDPERARLAAGNSGVAPLSRLADLEGRADAVVIAVPTALHRKLVLEAFELGMHVLVEKPIAATSEEASELVEAARSEGLTFAVGHVERFNPAVAQLTDHVSKPIHIEASRINPYTPRIGDGVIIDLMIHDLDIVLSLLPDGSEVDEISGVARAVKGETEDVAAVTVRFSNGTTAVFNASRLGQNKVRTIEVTQEDSLVTADLLRQGIEIHRLSHHEYVGDEGTRYRQSSVVEIPFIDGRGEPLFHEQHHFVQCVTGQATPRVSGEAGARALALAERALRSVSVSA